MELCSFYSLYLSMHAVWKNNYNTKKKFQSVQCNIGKLAPPFGNLCLRARYRVTWSVGFSRRDNQHIYIKYILIAIKIQITSNTARLHRDSVPRQLIDALNSSQPCDAMRVVWSCRWFWFEAAHVVKIRYPLLSSSIAAYIFFHLRSFVFC